MDARRSADSSRVSNSTLYRHHHIIITVIVIIIRLVEVA